MKTFSKLAMTAAGAAAVATFGLAPIASADPLNPPAPDPHAYEAVPGDSSGTPDGGGIEPTRGASGPSGGETNLSGGSGSPNTGTHEGGNGTGADGEIGGLVGGSEGVDDNPGGSASDTNQGYDGGQVDLDSVPTDGALVP